MTTHPYAGRGVGQPPHASPPRESRWRRSSGLRPGSPGSAEPSAFAAAWRSLAGEPWLCAGLLAAGIASNGIHAHVPLAAFAATGGVMLPRRRAITTVLLIWLANQLIGFGWRGYPQSATAFTWGAVMGLGTLLAVLLASWRPRFSRCSWRGHAIWQTLAVIAGLVLFEGAILLAYPLLGDGHAMGWATLLAIVRKELLWAGALALGHGWLLRRRQRRLESIVLRAGAKG